MSDKLQPGTPVWAHSDGTNVARGWHRAIVSAEHRGGYIVMLIEYGREFKSQAGPMSIRPRLDEGEINLPTPWSTVPFFRPDRNWKRREKANDATR